ncbi:Phage anti-repressor protein [uncultured Clostridium sp.]|uniref:Rha family transcriptional regulator n=1 Tax=uncultured Clostridium sp. TaxID=59620 RepID=UPI0008211EC7|nr:Rha family transcriptional regulator [uncultured Clostridium sp.]SCJ98930.1 Phage anti-repressor protein [uncultured Clostridium sp.]
MENLKHKHREGKMVVLENGELKIKSTELVDIINDFRKVESETTNSKYVELRHNDFMTKIRKELEVLKLLGIEGERNFSQSTYINSQNKVQPCFELNRDGMLQMLNSESALVRYKTIEYINKLEEQVKGQALNTSELSPELQMFNQMFKAMANNELETKEAKRIALTADSKAEEAKEEIQAIRDVVAINSTNWRKDTSTLISKIALKLGGYENINLLREESYKILEERGRTRLSVKLTNKRRRMADEGVCKSKRDKLNKLDVIGEDSRLLEIYLAVVKDMAIKYGV